MQHNNYYCCLGFQINIQIQIQIDSTLCATSNPATISKKLNISETEAKEISDLVSVHQVHKVIKGNTLDLFTIWNNLIFEIFLKILFSKVFFLLGFWSSLIFRFFFWNILFLINFYSQKYYFLQFSFTIHFDIFLILSMIFVWNLCIIYRRKKSNFPKIFVWLF